MTLLERIRRYLQAVEQGHAKLVRSLGLEPLQNKYLVRLADSWSGKRPLGESSAFKDFQREWNGEGVLFSFGVQVAAGLQEVATAEELPSLIRYFALTESLQGLIDDVNALLADLAPVGLTTARLSILRALTPRPSWSQSQLVRAERAPSMYCEQIGLVHADALTGVGRAALTFPDHMLVRWLLALEAEAASGQRDSWRMSREVMECLLRKPYDWFSDDIDRFPWFSWEGVCRLESFGLARTEEGPDAGMQIDQFGYQLTQLGKSVLAEVTSPNPPAPLSLVRGLLADNDAKIVAGLQSGDAGAAQSLEGELVRQIRTMSHELRNKLMPADMSLGTLEAELSPDAKRAVAALKLARRAVHDALGFVDSMATLAKGMSGPQDWLELGACLRDATRYGRNGNLQARVLFDGGIDDWDVLGGREELLLVASNLVRNALQAKPDAQVQLSATSSSDGLLLTIDDNGPGVPEEDRNRIFSAGYTTKPGGGGQGLALVRESLQRGFEGRIDCGASPAGGARFRILLPDHRFRPHTGGTR